MGRVLLSMTSTIATRRSQPNLADDQELTGLRTAPRGRSAAESKAPALIEISRRLRSALAAPDPRSAGAGKPCTAPKAVLVRR
jgi:hypothetical protein